MLLLVLYTPVSAEDKGGVGTWLKQTLHTKTPRGSVPERPGERLSCESIVAMVGKADAVSELTLMVQRCSDVGGASTEPDDDLLADGAEAASALLFSFLVRRSAMCMGMCLCMRMGHVHAHAHVPLFRILVRGSVPRGVPTPDEPSTSVPRMPSANPCEEERIPTPPTQASHKPHASLTQASHSPHDPHVSCTCTCPSSSRGGARLSRRSRS